MNNAKSEGNIIIFLTARHYVFYCCVSLKHSTKSHLIRVLFSNTHSYGRFIKNVDSFFFYKVPLSFSNIYIMTNAFPSATLMKFIVTKPYSLQWFYRKRLVTKVYYTCTWLNMIYFIVKDYVLRTHTEQCTIESQYFDILEKKHERGV